MALIRRNRAWQYLRALAAPILLWALVFVALVPPLGTWLRGEDSYDQAALQEWLREAPAFRDTLPEMIEDYLARAHRFADLRLGRVGGDLTAQEKLSAQEQAKGQLAVKREEIREHLRALGDPPTKMYAGKLPLFPIIYCLQVHFDRDPDLQLHFDEDPESPRIGDPITWDSELPANASQYEQMDYHLAGGASVYLRYQLHAYNTRQRLEQEYHQRLRQVAGLALAGTFLGVTWIVVSHRRERERERQQRAAETQVDLAERQLLEQARRHEETERKLRERELELLRAEGRALELKSQLYASIGIMAGSYAHNIKNLLVRPNDLLRRCLEADGLSGDQELMLHEVQQTLGTVTERLQQILRTVRRDPTRSEQTRLDLNGVLRDLERTWKDLARDKWKVELVLELSSGGPGGNGAASPSPPELWIAGDLSHLQQAVENLLFNARDATFEMRNRLRDEARGAADLDAAARRQALIAAASWKGRVVLRTRKEGGEVVLEVGDNGAGMTEEVRRRCTETHFSTKRDNAMYEGHSTGMGLGLSFVVAILEHHKARLEIESAPLRGTTFRVRFPAVMEGILAGES
jgi:signal transduction histidine kinase